MSKEKVDRHRTEVRNSAISGACAGFVSSIVTCPLDVVKTRLQVQTNEFQRGLRHRGALHAISSVCSKIWKEDGFRGFYRGLGPTVIGYLPTWAIYFCVYDAGKTFLSDNAPSLKAHPFTIHIASAMFAGATSTTCTSPMWVVKTRCMLQTSDVPEQLRYRNTLDAVIKIYRNEGIPAFYKGLLPSLLGVFHVIVQFPLYEHFKSMTSEGKRGDPLSPGSILLCSGASKMLASLATYPHEVLRTRMQMQQPTGTTGEKYTGFLQTITSIARKEGFRGFYRGMSVNLVRTVPNSGLTILTYELLMHYFAAHTST
ncbi:NAD transmembrane transporter [Malassezia pachydermatis]